MIEEKTAMYLNGTWLPNEVKDTAREDFPWGQFAFPTVPGGVDGPEAGAYGCTGLAINKNADPKVAEAAFSFFVFLTSGEWDKTYAEETRSIPMDQANAWPAAPGGRGKDHSRLHHPLLFPDRHPHEQRRAAGDPVRGD